MKEINTIIYGVFFNEDPYLITEKVTKDRFMEVFGTLNPDERDLNEAGFLLKEQYSGERYEYIVK
jgi:hypothetical protein